MNPSTALATVLVDELVRGGVREAVLAPGSRSAPLAYALQAAEAAGRLRLHVRVDERSAGFLALGLSKGSGGAPVPVVTTSGTAVANLHPAVLEAHHAGVPLVVLTADRPHELRGTGANQTTTQPGIYGGSVRLDADLPAPHPTSALDAHTVAGWRSTVCRALAAAYGLLGGDPGPVHLDLAFREPLVPDLAPGADDAAPTAGDDRSRGLPAPLEGRAGGGPWVEVRRPVTTPEATPVEHVDRTLVVVGDVGDAARGRAALAWAAARGYPVVAEPFVGLLARSGVVPHGPLLLTVEEWLDEHQPARVVVVGRVTLARPVARLLRRPGMRLEVVALTTAWSDPSHLAERVHSWAALTEVPRDGTSAMPPSAWAKEWQRAGRALAEAVAAEGLPWPSGLAVAAAVHDAVPGDGVLVVGSSNPVRDLDLATSGRLDAEESLPVFANRGLAGIDGLVSTAVGVGLATGRPTHALLGDLTFLHDANGLLIGPDEPRPDLTLVVVNDDGGGIFTTLEPGEPERADLFERVFGTSTGTDLGPLCRAHDVRHDVAGTPDELHRLLRRRPHGIRVVEVRVDRGSHRGAHAELRDLAARVLRT